MNSRRCFLVLLLLLGISGLVSCTSQHAPVRTFMPPGQPVPSDAMLRWYANALRQGRHHCNAEQIRAHQTWEGGVWYYDGARVYYQLADFTRDPVWERCAELVLDQYRRYVLDNRGAIPGWRVFPHGLYEHYRRTGDPQSKEALLLLARNSAFADEMGGANPELSRETAYLVHVYLLADQIAPGRFERQLHTAVDRALGHLESWSGEQQSEYVKPFMAALTMEALIHYAERRGDPRVLPAVQKMGDWLRARAWDDARLTFPYIVCAPTATHRECSGADAGPAPDLNLLIAPAYAWLYSRTGDERYGQMADRVFAGGVRQATLDQGKQYSQNYRWSFEYLRWRSGYSNATYLATSPTRPATKTESPT